MSGAQKNRGRGRVTWATGTKFKFLDSHATQWQHSLDDNTSSQFYSSVARLWIKKYGWFFDHWSDLENDTEGTVEDDLDFADGASSEDELEKCREYFDAMRTVHMLSFFGYLVIYCATSVFNSGITIIIAKQNLYSTVKICKRLGELSITSHQKLHESLESYNFTPRTITMIASSMPQKSRSRVR